MYLGVIKNFQTEQTSILNTLHTNILKKDIADNILVTAIDVHTTLIKRIVFIMLENVNITNRTSSSTSPVKESESPCPPCLLDEATSAHNTEFCTIILEEPPLSSNDGYEWRYNRRNYARTHYQSVHRGNTSNQCHRSPTFATECFKIPDCQSVSASPKTV